MKWPRVQAALEAGRSRKDPSRTSRGSGPANALILDLWPPACGRTHPWLYKCAQCMALGRDSHRKLLQGQAASGSPLVLSSPSLQLRGSQGEHTPQCCEPQVVPRLPLCTLALWPCLGLRAPPPRVPPGPTGDGWLMGPPMLGVPAHGLAPPSRGATDTHLCAASS